MTQRSIEMRATMRNRQGATLSSALSGQIWTRRELVEWVDRVLASADLSARTRRQVDLVRAWRVIQSGKVPTWTIDATESCGKVAQIVFDSNRVTCR